MLCPAWSHRRNTANISNAKASACLRGVICVSDVHPFPDLCRTLDDGDEASRIVGITICPHFVSRAYCSAALVVIRETKIWNKFIHLALSKREKRITVFHAVELDGILL